MKVRYKRICEIKIECYRYDNIQKVESRCGITICESLNDPPHPAPSSDLHPRHLSHFTPSFPMAPYLFAFLSNLEIQVISSPRTPPPHPIQPQPVSSSSCGYSDSNTQPSLEMTILNHPCLTPTHSLSSVIKPRSETHQQRRGISVTFCECDRIPDSSRTIAL